MFDITAVQSADQPLLQVVGSPVAGGGDYHLVQVSGFLVVQPSEIAQALELEKNLKLKHESCQVWALQQTVDTVQNLLVLHAQNHHNKKNGW